MEGIKPRWEAWETICIQKAFQEKIQLKIIAHGLGRTITSVSKKIKNLGLRGTHSIRGRLKGSKYTIPWREKTEIDRKIMSEILANYAPLSLSQKGKLDLRGAYWRSTPTSFSRMNRSESLGTLQKAESSFSLSFPLDYILSNDSMPKKVKKEKVYGDPYYVSLQHIEAWASSEGFCQMGKNLKRHGIIYWKEGKYFTKAQLLIYVNRIRLDKKLQPLAVFEEEDVINQGERQTV